MHYSGHEGGIKAAMEASHNSEPFDPELERIDDYKERFDFYCTAHEVADDRKKALFLTRIDPKNVFETQGMGKSHFLKRLVLR